jgi:hypothetical protein
MPYIGKQPLTGAYQLCDTITTSATATYNLTVGSSPVIPGAAQNCIVSLNGVIQAPVGAYTVSGSTIVFSSTLSATDVIDFILILGNVFDIGKPTDGSVTNASVASNAAIALSKLATTGTMTFATTIGVGGATPAASGAGITFPASVSASSDANTLDDYEQGTYTPSYSTSGGGQSVTTNIQSGQYTKIGNCVYFQLMIRSSSFTGGSGAIRIDLPFAASSSLQMVVYTGEAAGWTTNCPDKAYIGQSASHLILQRVSGTATVDITTSNITASGSSNLINCGGFYYTA